MPVSLDHSSGTDVPFKLSKLNTLLKKMANYGYGWYTQEQLEDYYDKMIGNFFNILSVFRITPCIIFNYLPQVTTPRL